MLPWDFWKLEPWELMALAEGARKRDEKHRYVIAWQTAYFLAPWSKKKITPEQLLGIKRKR